MLYDNVVLLSVRKKVARLSQTIFIYSIFRYKMEDKKQAPIRIIPKPRKSLFLDGRFIDLKADHWNWVVFTDEREFQKEAHNIASEILLC